MTDDERLQLFEALATAVRTAGLGWVVDEVTDLIEQGIEREVSASEWTGKRKPTRDEARITRREHTPLERVELLIDSTARVVEQGYDIEEAVARYFRNPEEADIDGDQTSPDEPPHEVRFMPDATAAERGVEGFSLAAANELEGRGSAVTELLNHLNFVRAQASG